MLLKDNPTSNWRIMATVCRRSVGNGCYSKILIQIRHQRFFMKQRLNFKRKKNKKKNKGSLAVLLFGQLLSRQFFATENYD
jgi:hypothetical protein